MTIEPYGLESQPIYALLADRIGHTSAEILRASSRRRVIDFRCCIEAEGYSYPTEMIEHLVYLPSPSDTPVDQAIQAIKAQSVRPAAEGPPEIVLADCLSRVEEGEHENPLVLLAALMEDAVKSISDRVQADPRYLHAKEAPCDQASVQRDDSRRAGIARSIDGVLSSFLDGSLDAQAAISRLEALRSEASTVDWTSAGGCEDAVLQVERALVSEAQAEFLEQNPTFIDGLVEAYAPVVAGLFD